MFDELDEVLQREFQIFLEERGITPALGKYANRYLTCFEYA